jgi:hypothetical protein
MISLLVPTRNRPQNVERLWKSITDTASMPMDIEMVLYVDNDDDSYNNLSFPVTIIKGPRIVLSEMWNKAAEKATSDILMYAADDIVFRTPNWDTKVVSRFDMIPDGIGFVFGNDGSKVHDGKYGTHGFVTKKWVKALGYVCPPHFSGDYSDTWINDIAKMVGRHFHIDIMTEHLHPDFGKTELDATYKEKYERMAQDKVAEKYASMHLDRVVDSNKLRKVMQ